jgi:2,4-dienoyl-CoA reductase-like NADH-dependent reductase (Old Yellow Enzyme family)
VAQADEIIIEGDADLVMIGRELLRQPYFALRAQAEIGAKPSWPVQYGYAVQPSGK